MGFGRSIRTVLRRYAEFDGRSGRAELWWWVLFDVLVLAAIDIATGGGPDDPDSRTGPAVAGLWTVATVLPTLAVVVRRLRDAGYRWTHLFWGLVPVAGVVILGTYLAQPTRTDPPPATDRPPAPRA